MSDDKRELDVTAVPSNGMYLTQNWIEGESPDGRFTFDLSCGAGLGSSHVKLSVKDTQTGKHVVEVFSMADLAQEWIAQITDEMEWSEG